MRNIRMHIDLSLGSNIDFFKSSIAYVGNGVAKAEKYRFELDVLDVKGVIFSCIEMIQ